MRLQLVSWRRDLGDSDMAWTVNQVTAMTKLWQEGLSASQVARQLGGTSRNAVIGKLHRLGLAGRPAPVRFRAPAGRSLDRTSSRGRSSGPYAVKRLARAHPSEAADPSLAPMATMQTLTASCCRWPIGDPRDPDFGFCGRARADLGSYCLGHAQVAFRRRGEPKPRIETGLERYLSSVRS